MLVPDPEACGQATVRLRPVQQLEASDAAQGCHEQEKQEVRGGADERIPDMIAVGRQ